MVRPPHTHLSFFIVVVLVLSCFHFFCFHLHASRPKPGGSLPPPFFPFFPPLSLSLFCLSFFFFWFEVQRACSIGAVSRRVYGVGCLFGRMATQEAGETRARGLVRRLASTGDSIRNRKKRRVSRRTQSSDSVRLEDAASDSTPLYRRPLVARLWEALAPWCLPLLFCLVLLGAPLPLLLGAWPRFQCCLWASACGVCMTLLLAMTLPEWRDALNRLAVAGAILRAARNCAPDAVVGFDPRDLAWLFVHHNTALRLSGPRHGRLRLLVVPSDRGRATVLAGTQLAAPVPRSALACHLFCLESDRAPRWTFVPDRPAQRVDGFALLDECPLTRAYCAIEMQAGRLVERLPL